MDKVNLILKGGTAGDLNWLKWFQCKQTVRILALVDPKGSDGKGSVPVYKTVQEAMAHTREACHGLIELPVSDPVALVQTGQRKLPAGDLPFIAHLLGQMEEAAQKIHWSNAVMEAAQEGIQVADADGKILYANAAFTRILNIPVEERIGKNVFDVSPDGGLAWVLRNGKSVFGNTHTTNGVSVIANASPIVQDGKIVGAVTVFNDASSVERMAHILKKSKEEIDSLREEIHQMNRPKYTFMDLVGEDQGFLQGIRQAKQAADSNSTVLITGESGTGKELFAHSIHEFGHRSKGPFIKVNCPAIPSTLLESELFGYEKGAFTGAAKTKMGKFELANGGTIFLDEIGDLDLLLQAKLLRVLQEREVERVGGTQTLRVDVRIIAATNQNLQELIEKGLFRKDLYYRLNVIHIHVPSLRERAEDIPLLAEQLLKRYARSNRLLKKVSDKIESGVDQSCHPSFEAAAIEVLCRYEWPGNVRELENVIEKLMIFSDCHLITKEDVVYALYAQEGVSLDEVAGQTLAAMEKKMILAALKRHGESLVGKKAAARELGISLTCLYDKVKKYRQDHNG